jgi:hypothetical protein
MKTSIKKSTSLQKPVDVFTECPRCQCKELIAVMGDVLCSACAWDSIEVYASVLFDQKIGLLFRPSEREVQNETLVVASPCSIISSVA